MWFISKKFVCVCVLVRDCHSLPSSLPHPSEWAKQHEKCKFAFIIYDFDGFISRNVQYMVYHEHQPIHFTVYLIHFSNVVIVYIKIHCLHLKFRFHCNLLQTKILNCNNNSVNLLELSKFVRSWWFFMIFTTSTSSSFELHFGKLFY